MNWSLIVASNNDRVLQSCLASSSCVLAGCDFQVMRGFASAGAAYNAGMREASGEILVFAHQDVYLPSGWEDQLAAAVARLSQRDPDWGVLGVWGIARDLKPRGFCYCTGLQKVLGGAFVEPVESTSLDELLLVLRRSAGLQFDDQLPGYHLYGTDICLTAGQRGLRSYLISAFCIHNTAGLKFLPWAFWRAYFYLRRKWWEQLPVRTPCTRIERVPLQLIEHPLRSAYSHWFSRSEPGQRVADPQALYQELVRSGRIAQTISGTGVHI